MTVSSNGTFAIPTINKACELSLLQLENNAYIHHYNKYGCTKELIYESIENCRSIIDTYKMLAK